MDKESRAETAHWEVEKHLLSKSLAMEAFRQTIIDNLVIYLSKI